MFWSSYNKPADFFLGVIHMNLLSLLVSCLPFAFASHDIEEVFHILKKLPRDCYSYVSTSKMLWVANLNF